MKQDCSWLSSQARSKICSEHATLLLQRKKAEMQFMMPLRSTSQQAALQTQQTSEFTHSSGQKATSPTTTIWKSSTHTPNEAHKTWHSILSSLGWSKITNQKFWILKKNQPSETYRNQLELSMRKDWLNSRAGTSNCRKKTGICMGRITVVRDM